uniref:EF-hand domain-containing protein n=1 Tax=Craspedostauros australis TaxID=1486917 RepID=A0A6T6FT51_9STRA|mmetsp:Transcript_17466/g.48452  ORF Transcript_17466/g.48452 Transcript_17466/m.48452 type:complete len:442 (+) Transcript_17466:32-1357(+)
MFSVTAVQRLTKLSTSRSTLRLGATAFRSSSLKSFNAAAPASAISFRPFSAQAAPTVDNVPGFVERPLKSLDKSMVRQIKAELMAVDKDNNGRLDAEELKQLLHKHCDVFTDEEVVEIGELYYAAKAGGSVRFDNFIEAIDRVADRGAVSGISTSTDDDHTQHFRESGRHPLGIGRDGVEFINLGKSHGHYTTEELDVKLTHVEPKGIIDKMAYNSVKGVRVLFDAATNWRSDNITANNVLNRTIYLETIAAVPGMVAAIVRHFRSLRTMKADGGYMQLFLEEANNERMHLLTFVRMKDPGMTLRAAVIVGQFGFGLAFTTAYILSPAFCHRFVGYVEEEACSTYTKIIKAIENAPEDNELAAWRTEQPPKIARAYWKLGETGTVLDLMYAVRADEAEHRDVNHLLSGVKEGQINPLYDPESKLDVMLTKYVKALMTRGKD